MYPNKVYHCPCVSLEIKLCLVNGQYSLKDICKKLNQSKEHRTIYCCKCGDGCVVFSCINNIRVGIFLNKQHGSYFELNEKIKNCRRCLTKYLQASYKYCYEHTDFNIPIAIKKKKKVLRVMV